MRRLYILFILPLLLSACDLDREPYGISDYWNTEADVMMGLDAAYEPLYFEDGFGRGLWWLDTASDDMTMNRNFTEITSLTNFTADGAVNASGNLYDNWQFMYRIIRRCNDVMKYAEQGHCSWRGKFPLCVQLFLLGKEIWRTSFL